MKLTKSRLKQIIKEELEAPRAPEAGSFTTAHGLKIVGPMGCDTRVTREGGKRDECLECVSKGKAYYPRMPAGQRCQEKDYTPDTPHRSTEPAEQVEESKNMKITKSQLKQMIEEELESLKEFATLPNPLRRASEATSAVKYVYDKLLKLQKAGKDKRMTATEKLTLDLIRELTRSVSTLSKEVETLKKGR